VVSRHGRTPPPGPPPLEPVDAPAERRWGLLTGETALVLGLIAVIVVGTFLINAVQPASSRTNTVYGKTTMKVHNLGKGGIQPGVVTPRKIVVPPPVVAAPTGATPLPTLAPPKGTTPTTGPTTAPTTKPTKAPGGGVLTPPTGGGGGSGGGGGCTLIVFGCDPSDRDTHQPTTPPTQPTTPSTSQTPPATGTTPETATKKTDKKKTATKPKPTPATATAPPAR
jgi:hypothetical protein